MNEQMSADNKLR